MADVVQRKCVECQGAMAPIVITDKAPGFTRKSVSVPLEYHVAGDRVSFWTGKFPTTGVVQAFLCAECGRIALYGDKPDTAAGAAADDGTM